MLDPSWKVDRSPLQRFVRFSRSHPIAASTCIVTALVSIVLGSTNVMRWLGPASNPAKVHYDTSKDILEVYDEKENLLWGKPSRGLAEIEKSEIDRGSRSTAIGDLNGDGRNEVIAMLPIESANSQPVNNSIRIFDSNGGLIASKALGDMVCFAGRTYQATQFGGAGLVLRKQPEWCRN